MAVHEPVPVSDTDAKPTEVSEDGAGGKRKWTLSPFVGMKEDLKRRAPHYIDDWKQGFHPKVLSSTLFMYVETATDPLGA
jgi:hypothetical protein